MCVLQLFLLFVSASCSIGDTEGYTENVQEVVYELLFLNNSIHIFLENNERGRFFYDQIQNVLREHEVEFKNIIHFTNSDGENNDLVSTNISLLRSNLKKDLKNIFNDGSVKKRSARRILRRIIPVILEFLSRCFACTTTSTTVSSVTEPDGSGSQTSSTVSGIRGRPSA